MHSSLEGRSVGRLILQLTLLSTRFTVAKFNNSKTAIDALQGHITVSTPGNSDSLISNYDVKQAVARCRLGYKVYRIPP